MDNNKQNDNRLKDTQIDKKSLVTKVDNRVKTKVTPLSFRTLLKLKVKASRITN